MPNFAPTFTHSASNKPFNVSLTRCSLKWLKSWKRFETTNWTRVEKHFEFFTARFPCAKLDEPGRVCKNINYKFILRVFFLFCKTRSLATKVTAVSKRQVEVRLKKISRCMPKSSKVNSHEKVGGKEVGLGEMLKLVERKTKTNSRGVFVSIFQPAER